MNHRVAQRYLVPLFIAVLSANAIAQEHPAVSALPNTVYVGADGKYEASPDTAVIEFSISAQEESSAAGSLLDSPATSDHNAAASPIQNNSGRPKDLPPAPWQAHPAARRPMPASEASELGSG